MRDPPSPLAPQSGAAYNSAHLSRDASIMNAFAAWFLTVSLAGATAPQGEVTLRLDTTRRPARGASSAPVLIVEFSDYKCHACEKFNLTIMPNLEKEFIGPGKVKLAFVDFPLIDDAGYTNTAESVHCAGEQGGYWRMHDLLWANAGALGDGRLADYAGKLGLDLPAFRRCLDEDRQRKSVLDDLKLSYSLGLSSRPTFFIGRRDGGQPESYRGRYVVGSQNYVVYRSRIQRLLREAGTR